MVLLQDGIIAFLSAVGLTTVVWLAAGTVLHAGRPAISGLVLVPPLRGEAGGGFPGAAPGPAPPAGEPHRAGGLRHERRREGPGPLSGGAGGERHFSGGEHLPHRVIHREAEHGRTHHL